MLVGVLSPPGSFPHQCSLHTVAFPKCTWIKLFPVALEIVTSHYLYLWSFICLKVRSGPFEPKLQVLLKNKREGQALLEHLLSEPNRFVSSRGTLPHPIIMEIGHLQRGGGKQPLPSSLIFLAPFPVAEDGVMRSTWQGKSGRSPLQALYESDQVRAQGEGDRVKREWGAGG